MTKYLDLDALLEPIPGEDSAGDRLTYLMVRSDFEKARKEDDPRDYEDDDPNKPEEFKRADWSKIVRDASDLFANKSKDLRIACWLVEALSRGHAYTSIAKKTKGEAPTAFAALAEGLQLLQRMASECWDRLLPPLDPDDPELRAGQINWLCDASGGARFPNWLRNFPMLVHGESCITWQDWTDAKGTAREPLDHVFSHASAVECQTVFQDLDNCVKELQALHKVLVEKMASAAPAMIDLRSAIADCYKLAKHFHEKKGPANLASSTELDQSESAGDNEHPAERGGAVTGVIASRADAYDQLRRAAEVLQRLEPHSPIPYLIMRAVSLGSRPFPEMIKAFVRNDDTIADMYRELGIESNSENSESPLSAEH